MAVQQEQWTKPPINCFFLGGGGKESTRYLELGYWIGFLEERGEEDRNAISAGLGNAAFRRDYFVMDWTAGHIRLGVVQK